MADEIKKHSHEHTHSHNHEHNREHSHSHEHEHACHGGCSCCHGHEEEENSKIKIIRIAAGLLIFTGGFIAKGNLKTILFIASYIIAGYDIVINAFKNILHGELFDENFLMAVASIGAICIGDFAEAPAVMLFYQIGESLQDYAFERSEKSVNKIMDIRPDHAYLLKNGERVQIEASEAKVGDIIVVAPGERVPLDGIIINGESYMDTSCITGESVKRKAGCQDEVLSGYVNSDSVVEIKVTHELSESAASRILDLMKNSLEQKSQSEKFITKFAKVYTPIVVGLALLTAVIPPFFDNMEFVKWIQRALTFLVISCPCALVISIPLGFFAGLGAASKKGLIVKGGNAIEELSKTNTVIFDKTGTLTEGVFEVSKIESVINEEDFLKLCAYAEYYSNHPVASAIKKKFGQKIDTSVISDYKEIAGKGISVTLSETEILAGNKKLMNDNNISVPDTDALGTIIYVASGGGYIGYIAVSDKIRDTKTVAALEESGIKTVMLTGDRKNAAKAVGKKLGLSEIRSELLPQDKVNIVKEIAKNNVCAFVGDGINDAPSLATANVGIAMGGIGSDAAIEAADVILINDDIAKIPTAIKLSKHTMKIVKENIVFSISVKVLIMVLGFIGFASMWLAIFADVGVALLAILNSMRALKA